MLGRYPVLTLALVFVTLTLTSTCRFHGFICQPFGSRCPRCIVTSGPRCMCDLNGGYDPYMAGAGAGAAGANGGRRHYVEPEKLRKMRYEMHPFSDRNIEHQTELLTHMARLQRIWS